MGARFRAAVDMCAGPEGGHLGGALSCTDVLTALYFSVLNANPHRPDDPMPQLQYVQNNSFGFGATTQSAFSGT